MKKLIFILVTGLSLFLFHSCDEDDTVTKSVQQDVTIAQFLDANSGNIPGYTEYITIAKTAIINEQIATKYDLPFTEIDEFGNAVVSKSEEGTITYVSFYDLLSKTNANITVLIPRTLNLESIAKDSLEERMSLSNQLLYLTIEGQKKKTELTGSILPLSSEGTDELIFSSQDEILKDIEFSEEFTRVILNGSNLGIDKNRFNLEASLNGIVHDLVAANNGESKIELPDTVTFEPIPFVTGDIEEITSGQIVLNYNRNIKAPSTPEDYILLVDGIKTTITNVNIDSENPNKVLLTPEHNISNKALDIKLSFNSGNLISNVDGIAKSFTNKKVFPFTDNLILNNADFELPIKSDGTIAGLRNTAVKQYTTLNNDIVFKGKNSLRVTNFLLEENGEGELERKLTNKIFFNGAFRTENIDNLANVPTDASGTYRFQMQVYIEDLKVNPITEDTSPVNFKVFIRPHSPNKPQYNTELFDVSFNNDKVGTWQQISIDIPGNEIAGFGMRFQFRYENNLVKNTPFIFYMDDMQFFKLDEENTTL